MTAVIYVRSWTASYYMWKTGKNSDCYCDAARKTKAKTGARIGRPRHAGGPDDCLLRDKGKINKAAYFVRATKTITI